MKPIKLPLIALLAVGMPLVASAQTITDLPSLFSFALNMLNEYVVPIIFAIAFIIFLIGIYRYFIQNGGNAEKTAEGRQFLLWSLIGFFVMFSVWGLINLFLGTFGFNNAAQPGIPTFTNTGASATTNTSIFGTGSSAAVPGTAVNGQFCINNADCQSGSCVGGTCSVSTGFVQNGQACTDGSPAPSGNTSSCVACGCDGVTGSSAADCTDYCTD